MFVGCRPSAGASLGGVLANVDNHQQVQQSQPQKDMAAGLRPLRDEGMNFPPGNQPRPAEVLPVAEK